MPQSLDGLISWVDALLEELDQAEDVHAADIAAVAEVHRVGAVNLVRYTGAPPA